MSSAIKYISIFIIVTLFSITASAQIVSYNESEKLLKMDFETANNYLISKKFEYTSAKEETKGKWLFFRRLNNDREYEVGIYIVEGGYINGVHILTTNFYEANIYKKELEADYKIVANQLKGQDLATCFIHKEYIFKRGEYTVSVDPNGSGKKAYFIYLYD